jgi:hypothetical protein
MDQSLAVFIIQRKGLADWSLLTSFLMSNAALCGYEGQRGRHIGGSMPHVWGETG